MLRFRPVFSLATVNKPLTPSWSLPLLLSSSSFASSKSSKGKQPSSASSQPPKPKPPKISLTKIEELSKTFFQLGGAYRARDEGSDFFRAQAFFKTAEKLEQFRSSQSSSTQKTSKKNEEVDLDELQKFLNLKSTSSVWGRIVEAVAPATAAASSSSNTTKIKPSKASISDNQKMQQRRKKLKESIVRELPAKSPAEFLALDETTTTTLMTNNSSSKNGNSSSSFLTPQNELAQFQEDPYVRSAQFISTILGFGTKAAGAISKFFHDHPQHFPSSIKTIENIESFRKVIDKLLSDRKLQKVLENKYANRKLFPMNHTQLLGLKYYNEIKKRIPRPEVEVHEKVLRAAAKKSKLEMQICGSYRRKKPTCGDVDCIIWSKQHKNEYELNTLLPKFLAELGEENQLQLQQKIVKGGSKKNTIKNKNHYIVDQFATGDRKFMGLCRLPKSAKELPPTLIRRKEEKRKLDKVLKKFSKKNKLLETRRLDIRVVPKELVPSMLLYFTGSAAHNVLMRQIAIGKRMLLNEYGLFENPQGAASHYDEKTGTRLKKIPCKSEEEIFKVLGMKYKKPEDRE